MLYCTRKAPLLAVPMSHRTRGYSRNLSLFLQNYYSGATKAHFRLSYRHRRRTSRRTCTSTSCSNPYAIRFVCSCSRCHCPARSPCPALFPSPIYVRELCPSFPHLLHFLANFVYSPLQIRLSLADRARMPFYMLVARILNLRLLSL